jgi:hypothetical protein
MSDTLQCLTSKQRNKQTNKQTNKNVYDFSFFMLKTSCTEKRKKFKNKTAVQGRV